MPPLMPLDDEVMEYALSQGVKFALDSDFVDDFPAEITAALYSTLHVLSYLHPTLRGIHERTHRGGMTCVFTAESLNDWNSIVRGGNDVPQVGYNLLAGSVCSDWLPLIAGCWQQVPLFRCDAKEETRRQGYHVVVAIGRYQSEQGSRYCHLPAAVQATMPFSYLPPKKVGLWASVLHKISVEKGWDGKFRDEMQMLRPK